MKILELCPYSSGVCGVWARVREEATRLSQRSHEVRVFSSDFVKGTDKHAPNYESINGLEVHRFPATKLGGESFMRWDFIDEAIAFEPDVIIAHNYRHPHTTKALKIARELGKNGKKCKVFLVTHAPFVEGNITRSRFSKFAVWFYDKFIGPRTLPKFDKIFPISHWEIPYLLKFGAKEDKIVYIPNGIPEMFFTQSKDSEKKKILFLGRISPKKKIETLIEASSLMKNKKVKIEIVGPPEEEYFNFLKNRVKEMNVESIINFLPPVTELTKKIKLIDSAKIFVLPSRVEGMPQSLIEAMARGKIAIGSDSIAIRDLIRDGKNGFLFEFNNAKSLALTIDKAMVKSHTKIRQNARNSVKEFSWDKVIEKIEEEISK